jgi:transposase-like protein
LETGIRKSEVTKLHDIDRQVIHTWLKRFDQLGSDAFVDKSLITKDTIIKKLARENQKQKVQIEILKKAIAYVERAERKK